MQIRGEVSRGMGRAQVFMSQKHYQSQFKRILGVTAWPGTLNVDLGKDCIQDYKNLRIISRLDEGFAESEFHPFRIDGFERDGKSFGGATAFLAEISVSGGKWEKCAVLIPDLTRHTSTAEVISGSFLREVLPCCDGEVVRINLI